MEDDLLRIYRPRSTTKPGSGAQTPPPGGELAATRNRERAVSQYGFGYDETDGQSDLGEAATDPQGPKWFREGLAKLSGQVNELKAENDRLKQAQTQSQIAESLKAKGYAPQAAGLYAGEPAGLDDWLKTNAGALAKLPAGEGGAFGSEEGQAPTGPPATVVTPESQAALAAMQGMGTGGVAPSLGSDREVAARIDAMDEAQFDDFMRSQGNRFF